MRAGARVIYKWLAALILAAVTSSGRFPEVSTLGAHRALGDLIILLALILVLVALAGGLRGSDMGHAGGLVILTLLQSVLAHLGTDTGAVFGGLHVLNALAILGLSARIVSVTWRAAPAAAP
jgi:hypothetical protein